MENEKHQLLLLIKVFQNLLENKKSNKSLNLVKLIL